METHSSILAWRTPWTEEHGRLQSIVWEGVGHNQSNLACTQPSLRASQVVLVVKNLPANAGDLRDDMSHMTEAT